MTDPSLPCTGPGRASDGNFVLDEFRSRRGRGQPGGGRGRALRNPVGRLRGGLSWGIRPVAAAIDGDPRTGWSVHPQEGLPHAVIFPTRRPIGSPGGTVLEFTLKQGWPLGHNLGRLRLSATTAKPPITGPRPAEPRSVVVKGQLPASANRGLLVVYAQLKTGDRLVAVAAPGALLSAKGTLAGKSAAWQPVLAAESSVRRVCRLGSRGEPSSSPRRSPARGN